MPRVSAQYRDARREQILDAARRCFLRDGFQATSMQDLFAEAGLSSGAVYRYFASKDELILAIAADNMRDVVQMVHTIAAGGRDASIGDALADVIAVLDARHAETGLGALAIQVWAETLRKPAMAQRFAAMVAQLRTDLVEVVRAHQAAGNLPSQVPAAAVASVLIGVVPGHIVQLAVLGPTATEGAVDALRALWPHRAEPHPAEPHRAEPHRAEPHRAEPAPGAAGAAG